MKLFLITLLCFFGQFTWAAKNMPVYNIDPAHSKVGFEIPHLVISTVEGRFTDFSGSIHLDEEKLSESKFTSTIKIKSIDTGTPKRDDHLRGADFFDADKFPDMTFVSRTITGTKNNLTVVGDLTIKGKTKSVTLVGKFLGSVMDPYGNKKAAFDATTKINRKDFGLTWSKMVEAGPVVGDEVTISLKIQAALAKK